MEKTTLDTLKESFEVLPPDVQLVIKDKNTFSKIKILGSKHNLTEDNISTLTNEIFLVLFGLEVINKLQNNIVVNLKIPEEQASKIYTDVKRDILSTIFESLKEMGEEIESVNQGNRNISSDTEKINKTAETTPSTPSDHLLQSHEMIKEPHLHSQTVMPEMEKDNKSAPKSSFFSRMHNNQHNPSVKPNVIREEQIPVPKPPVSTPPPTPIISIVSEPEKKPEPFVVKAPEPVQTAPTPVTPPPAPTSTPTTPPQNKFSSIVDQKLSRLVRTERDNTQIRNEVEKSRQEKYGTNDPYREPIK